MIHIQSILAATDFSSNARNAEERAAMLGTTLAIRRRALLHVQEQSWIDFLKRLRRPVKSIRHGIIENASHSWAEHIEEISRFSDFFFEPQLRTGNVLDVIAEVASGFDIIVLGASERHFIRSLLGTTSQRLLEKIKCPMLVVKRKPYEPYRRILVAIDFSPNSHKVMAYGSVIAPKACIFLVHIFKPLFEMTMRYAGVSDELIEENRTKAYIEAEKQMIRFMGESEIDFRYVFRYVEHGQTSSKLIEMARKCKPDLIVIGKHSGSRIEEFLRGSVTTHVLIRSQCDVLVV